MGQGQEHGQIEQIVRGMDTGSGTQPADKLKTWPDDRHGDRQDGGLAALWSLY